MVGKTVKAAEFKAKCLDLMDQVAATGNPVTITKRGKPVAQLVPVVQRPRSLLGALKGHIKIKGDIVGEIAGDDEWEAMR
jgi:prevent-host-death family protein